MAADTSFDSVVTEECLHELLDFFIKNAYKARNVDRRVSRWGLGLVEGGSERVNIALSRVLGGTNPMSGEFLETQLFILSQTT